MIKSDVVSESNTISKVSKEINDFHDPLCSDEEKFHLLKQKTRIDEEIVTINVRIKEVRNVLKGNIVEEENLTKLINCRNNWRC